MQQSPAKSIKNKFGNRKIISYIWVGTYYGVSELIFSEDTYSIKPPTTTSDKLIFDILPNPTSSKFTIRTDRQPEVCIYNSTGGIITTRQINSNVSKEFDLSYRPAGVYFIKATSRDKVLVKKIIRL